MAKFARSLVEPYPNFSELYILFSLSNSSLPVVPPPGAVSADITPG